MTRLLIKGITSNFLKLKFRNDIDYFKGRTSFWFLKLNRLTINYSDSNASVSRKALGHITIKMQNKLLVIPNAGSI
jgi:hypothetical protein